MVTDRDTAINGVGGTSMANQDGFQEHPHARKRRQSAIRAIKALLPLDLYLAHKRELVSICLWKLSLAAGPKFKTRFRSRDSHDVEDRRLRHTHVHRHKLMVDLLLENKDRTEKVDEIAEKVVACVVTREELEALNEVDRQCPDLNGWPRYKRAGIVVIDMLSGEEFRIGEDGAP